MLFSGTEKMFTINKISMKQIVVYQLTDEDVQEVAKEELGRKLRKKEIISLIDSIGERINWYDIIAAAILDTIGEEHEDEL